MGRLIILAGPSCVGKSPLLKALRDFYPDLTATLSTVVLYNSRAPRPGEKDGEDYHFRSREEIEAMRGREGIVVIQARADLQALDLPALQEQLESGDVLFEGNPFVGLRLLDVDVPKVSAFIAPLDAEEVRYLSVPERGVSLPDLVTDVMRRKLLRRTTRQKGILSLPDLEDIENRCRSAYGEMCDAWRFGSVIPNHDGEDSENWNAFYYPVGDARRTLEATAALLKGTPTDAVECWPQDLLQP